MVHSAHRCSRRPHPRTLGVCRLPYVRLNVCRLRRGLSNGKSQIQSWASRVVHSFAPGKPRLVSRVQNLAATHQRVPGPFLFDQDHLRAVRARGNGMRPRSQPVHNSELPSGLRRPISVVKRWPSNSVTSQSSEFAFAAGSAEEPATRFRPSVPSPSQQANTYFPGGKARRGGEAHAKNEEDSF